MGARFLKIWVLFLIHIRILDFSCASIRLGPIVGSEGQAADVI